MKLFIAEFSYEDSGRDSSLYFAETLDEVRRMIHEDDKH